MESVTLQRILEAFNAPINEEQAWGVCYQCAQFLKTQWESESGCLRFSGLKSLALCKDGSVTGIGGLTDSSGAEARSESELVQSLGVIIYQALDYGLGDNEEHTLSPPLEALIGHMTGSDEDEADDEGIEHDGIEAGRGTTLDDVIQACVDHVGAELDSAAHYKAVCRALVAESYELITFLDKISIDREKLHAQIETDEEEQARLEELQRSDWARMWLQVMRQLRHGIKLKKLETVSLHPAEFELTPYEMLMEDIRSRRYTLNKIMVNGDIPPQTKKDAHSIILEFIRSRPPLHPVKDRKIRDAPERLPDVREQLLCDIRSEPKLKPVPSNASLRAENRLDNLQASPTPGRKVIKADVTLFLDHSSEEESTESEEEDDDDVFEDKNKVPLNPMSPLSPLSPPALDPSGRSPWQQSVDLDVESQEVSFHPERRHSLTLVESPCGPSKALESAQMANGRSPASGKSSTPSPRPIKPSLECLSLTIEEVMHIRSVLTKAELESLLVDPELYELVSKAKVCFRCKKTKFALFGLWSTKCKFCGRYVCSHCFSKMRVPTEHFEHIPVYTLSPSPLTPGSAKFDFLFPFELSGSAPPSPTEDNFPELQKSAPPPRPPPPQRQPTIHVPDSANNNSSQSQRSRPPLQRSKTLIRPPPRTLEGPMMNVCKDCKAMIVNIIRASRYSLSGPGPSRDRPFVEYPPRIARRNFHLDLKPVYK